MTASILLVILLIDTSPAREKDEDTYTISLTQTADVDEKIREINDSKVLTEIYTVREGDHLWQLFRERGLLKDRNLSKLISTLKKLNNSLKNLDLIQPGEKIIIPLVISPLKSMPSPLRKTTKEIPIPFEAIKDLKLENYTVKQGESIIKIVKGLYDIPREDLYNEYLQLVKRLNPSVNDLSTIYPGQTVRLPIYSPQVVKMPVEARPKPAPIPTEKVVKEELTTADRKLHHQLEEIFTKIGEEWIRTGQHFIPLKSGGQANLKAGSFPIINLSNGHRIIIDMNNDLPDKIAGLIKSSWENYSIIKLGEIDNLSTALDRILPECGYQKILKSGEPFELGGDIPLRITADWIIILPPGHSDGKKKIIMITLAQGNVPKTPPKIQAYLANIGIQVIDYPSGDKPLDGPDLIVDELNPGKEISALIEMLLKQTGRSYSKKEVVPVFKGEKTDFDLIVHADFFLNLNGKKHIIDLTGLGTDFLSLLREHRISVLSLAGEKDPTLIITRTLDFLGIQFDSKPHLFPMTGRDDSRNIKVTIPGIIFPDEKGRAIFATHIKLPREIADFLSLRAYKILYLTLP